MQGKLEARKGNRDTREAEKAPKGGKTEQEITGTPDVVPLKRARKAAGGPGTAPDASEAEERTHTKKARNRAN